MLGLKTLYMATDEGVRGEAGRRAGEGPEAPNSPVREETAQYSAFISWATLSASFSMSAY